MSSQKIFEYNDESHSTRLARKSKDSPFMIIEDIVLDGHLSIGVMIWLRTQAVTGWKWLGTIACGALWGRPMSSNGCFLTGIIGLIGVCSYGAYKFKNKGKMSTSVYLMQLRVAAQGTVVGALTIGLAYSLVQKHLFKDKKE